MARLHGRLYTGTLMQVVGFVLLAFILVFFLARGSKDATESVPAALAATKEIIDDDNEGLSLDLVDGRYQIYYFNYKEKTLNNFNRKELQGGGYTWESLVRAGLQQRQRSLLDQVEFDPEGDVFVLYSHNLEAAEAVKAILLKLNSDAGYLAQCIEFAQSRGYLE